MKKLSSRSGLRPEVGFTLVELMIVVAIIGVISAIAIPSFMKYVKKAKTAEAPTHLEKISNAARQYFAEDHHPGGQIAAVPPQYPDTTPVSPAVRCCNFTGNKCRPSQADWDDPTWISLKFALDDPHYFRYAFTSSGTATEAKFTASAHADLDCDNEESTFRAYGENMFQGADTSSGLSISRLRELE